MIWASATPQSSSASRFTAGRRRVLHLEPIGRAAGAVGEPLRLDAMQSRCCGIQFSFAAVHRCNLVAALMSALPPVFFALSQFCFGLTPMIGHGKKFVCPWNLPFENRGIWPRTAR